MVFLWVGSKVSLILLGLHLEDVRDDAVNLDVPYKAGEEEVLQGVGMKRAKGGEEKKEPGETVLVPGVGGAGVVGQLGDHLVLQPLHTVVVCKERGRELCEITLRRGQRFRWG